MSMKNRAYKVLFLLAIIFVAGVSNKIYAACTTPGNLSGVSTAGITSSSVTWNYTVGSNTTNVQVYVYSNAAMTATVFAVYAGSLTTFTRTTSLNCGTQYWYRLIPYNGANGGCTGTATTGTFTMAACPTCSDGIQNGTETGVDCGGSCPACAGGAALPQTCNPCGAGGASGLTAILPTAGGACYTYTANNTCGVSTAAQYDATCAAKSGGNYYNTGYRTWVKLTVPATGTITGYTVPTEVGTNYPKITIFSNVTCGATNFSAWTLESCNFQNISNCGGGYTCGDGGTIVNTDYGYGEQFTATGLTPGTTVYACIDYLIGAANSDNQICFYDNFASGSSNFIGLASQICGGTITGTTLSSIQGLSVCDGYKPASCGGGPGPSFENVSIYQMTSDAVGSDMTITLDPSSCVGTSDGLQMLVYQQGDISGCTGSTPVCGSGTCTLGACVGGSTISGMATKTVTIVAPTPLTNYYVLVDGFAGAICDFTIASSGCIVLPVTLSNFSLNKKDDGLVVLSWATTSEKDNDYFELERSFDGSDFRRIGRVDGAGNSLEVKNYKYNDFVKNHTGTIYYRLKQIDFDGRENYSVIRSTSLYSDNTKELIITPNPNDGIFDVTYFAENQEKEAVVSILDVNGNIVHVQTITNIKGFNSANVNVQGMLKGVYLIKVETNSKTMFEKIVKY